MTTLDVLRAARERVRDQGDDMLSAVLEELGEHKVTDLYREPFRSVQNALRAAAPELLQHRQLGELTDLYGDNEEGVLALFDRAISAEESKVACSCAHDHRHCGIHYHCGCDVLAKGRR